MPRAAAVRARKNPPQKSVSLQQLRRLAEPGTIEHDRAAGSYSAIAPPGYRWAGVGTHEIVSWYPEETFAAEAREALADDLRGEALIPCDDPDCEFCLDHPAVEENPPDEDQLLFLQKKFDEVVQEQPKWEELRRVLLGLGGDAVVAVYDPDIGKLLKRGRKWPGHSAELHPGEPINCHANVANLWEANEGRLKICTGYALSDDGLWRQHTWGLWNNRVIETTEKRKFYYGFILTPSEAADFADNNY